MLARFATCLLLCLVAAAPAARAQGERMEDAPAALRQLKVVEHAKEQLPLNLEFRDESGAKVKLADYFGQGKPVILTLNYLACPMLCTLTLNGMTDALKQTGLEPGRDFEIVTVSFVPTETPHLATAKKRSYVDYYGEDSAMSGWHFLTGEQPSIDAIVRATGFSYEWDAANQQWAHPAVLVVATPEGVISRYLYGVSFDVQTMRLTLVDAGKGRIGTPLDQILLYCYHYNSATGRYAPLAMNIMRAGGMLTLLVLAIVLTAYWNADRRRRRKDSGDLPVPPGALGEPTV